MPEASPIIVANDFTTLNIPRNPKDVASLSVQGEKAAHAEDNSFTWSLQKSLNGGLTWTKVKDKAGVTDRTGSDDVDFRPVRNASYRVQVTALGTATIIWVSTN